jgi:predicted peptidase
METSWLSAAVVSLLKLGGFVKVTLKYLLYLPKNYEQKPSWPLVLFLHGQGECGDDLELIKKHGLPKLIAAGQEFPFIIVAPQCPSNRWWHPSELTALLDEIVEKFKVDQDRIYVTGMSMGGYGTWALAAHTPHRFAAIVPICGGGYPSRMKRIVHLPVWVFHGAHDPAVPLEMSQMLVEALKRHSGNVQFTVYPEAEHDAWSETYANPQVYRWLLDQKREPTADVPDERTGRKGRLSRTRTIRVDSPSATTAPPVQPDSSTAPVPERRR